MHQVKRHLTLTMTTTLWLLNNTSYQRNHFGLPTDHTLKVCLLHFWNNITTPNNNAFDANQGDQVFSFELSYGGLLSEVVKSDHKEVVMVDVTADFGEKFVDDKIEELDGLLRELDELGVEFAIEFEEMGCIDIIFLLFISISLLKLLHVYLSRTTCLNQNVAFLPLRPFTNRLRPSS